MFETTGTIDRGFYDKYTLVLYSGFFENFLFWVLGAAFVIVLTDSIFDLVLLVEFLIAIVVIAALCVLHINWFKKIVFAQLLETTGNASYQCESFFEEDAAVFKNHALNSTSKIMYNSFVKFKKTDAVWFLFTKAGLFVPVFVEILSVEEKEALLGFLRARLTKVKKI